MFKSLPAHFREYNLKADVRTLMLLRKSIDKGLVRTLGDMYLVLKGLLTNDPKDYGPYTTAFYKYFLDVNIKKGESLEDAVKRSKVFENWKEMYLMDLAEDDNPDMKELVNRFLNQVHLSTYDIQEILNGEDIFNKDNPDLEDQLNENGENENGIPRDLQKIADYNNISIEELMERMLKIAEKQKDRHQGGSHWIGQGGISPYGNSGGAMGGIRIGGNGGGKMARKVIGDRNFYPIDTKQILQDNNIDVALSYLKGIEDETADLYLDIPKTIKEGVKEGGLFLPIEKEKIDQKVQVVLLIDNGGWSMTPYIKSVTKMFSKMKRRFAHDLKTYYYHNTIYGGAFTDVRRTQFEPIEKMLTLDKNYSIFIIGDADMALYELSRRSIEGWQSLKETYTRIVWLNPLDERYWAGSATINILKQIFPMFPLSPDGIEKAVNLMNRNKRYGKQS